MENRYAVPIDALEGSAHVPLDEQVEEHAEPPPPDVVDPERVARDRLVRIAAIGG
jgi:hypothetical protein